MYYNFYSHAKYKDGNGLAYNIHNVPAEAFSKQRKNTYGTWKNIQKIIAQ